MFSKRKILFIVFIIFIIIGVYCFWSDAEVRSKGVYTIATLKDIKMS